MTKSPQKQIPPDFLHKVWAQLPLHIRLNIAYTTWSAVRPPLPSDPHRTGKRLLTIQILACFIIVAFLLDSPTITPLTPLIGWAGSVCVAIILTTTINITERRLIHKLP